MGRSKKMLLITVAELISESLTKAGDEAKGKDRSLIPSRNLTTCATGIPSRNPRFQIEPGGLALAG